MNTKVYLSSLLRDMGISPKYLGYIYLEEIALYAFENRLFLKSLSRYVYPHVAQKFDAAPKSVEKAVDNVITRTFEKGGLTCFAGQSCPSNKEVISYCVNKLAEYSYKWSNIGVSNFR